MLEQSLDTTRHVSHSVGSAVVNRYNGLQPSSETKKWKRDSRRKEKYGKIILETQVGSSKGVIRSDKQQVQTKKQQTPTKCWKDCMYNYMKKSTRTARRAASMECLEMKKQILEIN